MSATEEQVTEQTEQPQQTAEERSEEQLGNFLFGEEPQEPVVEGEESEVEEPEGETEEVEEPEAELFEYTVGENTYEVPEELKEELEKAKDYTQKTQGVKQEWETAQVKMAEVKGLHDQYAFLESVQDEINQGLVLDNTINEWNQYLSANVGQMDANQVAQAQIKIKEMETQKQAIADSLQVKYTDHQQAQEQTREELLNKSTDVLRQRIPNWGDEQDKVLRDYALSNGYTDSEYDNLVDPRLKETLWKAQQFDRAKDGIETSKQTIKSASKIKPTSRNPMPKGTQDKLNLRKKLKSPNRSAADKAELIGQDVAKRFGM